MATLLSRPVSFPDIGISDQDQDPNSALLELDRGLKSTQIGDQCESISRFPSLFEKYPFPILINSALLKLAEVFRQETPGSNFVRVCVVEVIEASSKHLDKLINIEEFLRRITTVMHSNDPMARALTLRTLGSISVVVGENRQVHHLIREALDAKDSVELQAAIYAAEKYASQSKSFAMNMCEHLTSMIGGLATPVDVKLQLIKIFQHMHHDVETAATVRELCLKLLKEYPTQRVAITTMRTLTELAAHSLVDIPQQDLILDQNIWILGQNRMMYRMDEGDNPRIIRLANQVDLLMECLQAEARIGIRRSILEELDYLARTAPHAWVAHNIDTLIKFADSSRQNILVECNALNILSNLLASPAFSLHHKSTETSLLDLGKNCIYDSDLNVASKGLLLLTNLALYVEDENEKRKLCEEALDGSLNLLQSVVASPNFEKKTPVCLSSCLMCIVALAKNNSENSISLIQILLDTLKNKSLSSKTSELICETLASLGGYHSNVLSTSHDSVVDILTHLKSQGQLDSKKTKLMNFLFTLMLQMFHCHKWEPQALAAVSAASEVVNQWTAYRMARQSSRYGHHNVAFSIYNKLSRQVCSDQQHFWLLSLAEISQGESLMMKNGDRADNMMAANFFLLRALSSLKAASSTGNPMSFCQEYVMLRAESMMCHAQLLHACLSLRTAPPPAIAAPLVSSTSGRDDLLRCGRVAQQLTKALKDFNNLASRYGKLYQSCFDGDPTTLCNIALLQEGVALMAKVIELVISPFMGSGSQFTSSDLTSTSNVLGGRIPIEIQTLMNAIEAATSIAHKLAQVCNDIKPVREQHLHLLQDISQTLTTIPHPYPRFFFQRLQNTTITLNLSPQPRTPSDPICVQTSGHLAIKVEGVIIHGRHLGLYRTVQSVCLSVNSSIQNRPPHTLDLKIEPNESLSQTVKPHNDFFAAHFLLGFPIPGLYQVTVEASVTDTEDDAWQTGPCLSLSVKSLEDLSGKQTIPQIRPVHAVPTHSVTVPPAGGQINAITTSSTGDIFPAVTNAIHQFTNQRPL